jgi:hypothetical protein
VVPVSLSPYFLICSCFAYKVGILPKNWIKLAHYLADKESFSDRSREADLFPLSTPSIWKKRETERFGSCQSLITSIKSAKICENLSL